MYAHGITSSALHASRLCVLLLLTRGGIDFFEAIRRSAEWAMCGAYLWQAGLTLGMIVLGVMLLRRAWMATSASSVTFWLLLPCVTFCIFAGIMASVDGVGGSLNIADWFGATPKIKWPLLASDSVVVAVGATTLLRVFTCVSVVVLCVRMMDGVRSAVRQTPVWAVVLWSVLCGASDLLGWICTCLIWAGTGALAKVAPTAWPQYTGIAVAVAELACVIPLWLTIRKFSGPRPELCEVCRYPIVPRALQCPECGAAYVPPPLPR